MFKKIAQRYLPSVASLRKNRRLGRFGEAIFAPALWHFSRKPVSRGLFMGLFFACPPIPFQMVIVVALCTRITFNLPVALTMVWITNPLTIVPITYLEYKLGIWLLGTKAVSLSTLNQMSSWMDKISYLSEQLSTVFLPLLVGSLVLGITIGTSTFIIVNLIWRWRIRYAWQLRAKRRYQTS